MNKIALITGANRGLGLEAARQLAQDQGFTVILGARDRAKGEAAAAHLRASGLDELVAELLAADHIAISTPVYNYNVPANLKSYVDHIVRKGLTLGMKGEGLIHGKKMHGLDGFGRCLHRRFADSRSGHCNSVFAPDSQGHRNRGRDLRCRWQNQGCRSWRKIASRVSPYV